MASRLFRNLLLVAVVSVMGIGVVNLSWRMIGGGPLPLHGWIALSLGVLGTVALAWTLMGLAFRSSREGWDDRADTLPDVEPDASGADRR